MSCDIRKKKILSTQTSIATICAIICRAIRIFRDHNLLSKHRPQTVYLVKGFLFILVCTELRNTFQVKIQQELGKQHPLYNVFLQHFAHRTHSAVKGPRNAHGPWRRGAHSSPCTHAPSFKKTRSRHPPRARRRTHFQNARCCYINSAYK